MSFKEALQILGLKSNFTKEELKKAHRRLSFKYHPDRNKAPEATKKMKEVNVAYNILAISLEENQNGIDLNTYKEIKVTKLEEILTFDLSQVDKEMSSEIKNIIIDMQYTLVVFKHMTVFKDKQSIDIEFAYAIQKIKNYFKEWKNQFYKEFYIDENEVRENINYDCNVKEFYDNLLKIKEKYSKETKIKKQLEEETNKYKNYAGYEKLEILIEICIKNTLFNIKKNKFQNIEQEIQKMHQQITTEVFEAYYTLKRKITELDVIVDAINDEKIKNKYTTLKEKFQQGQAFVNIENDIEKLENLIAEYQKKQGYMEANGSKINDIYQSLINRYVDNIKNYNIATEYSSINNLNKFLNEVLQVFNQGIEETKELDYFNLFNGITFKRIADDSKILKIITNLLKTQKTNKSNIYIKVTDEYTQDSSFFYYFDEENMIMYKDDYPNIGQRKITQEEFETEYVSIEKFLEQAIFVGEYRRKLHIPIKYLYKTDKTALYFYNDKFCITSEKHFSILTRFASTNPKDPTFEPFKDKKYVCEMIEKQVKARVEQYKKQQSKQANSYSLDKRIFGEPQYNDNDPYGYNESPHKKRR